jgi:hypothetical protein
MSPINTVSGMASDIESGPEGKGKERTATAPRHRAMSGGEGDKNVGQLRRYLPIGAGPKSGPRSCGER